MNQSKLELISLSITQKNPTKTKQCFQNFSLNAFDFLLELKYISFNQNNCQKMKQNSTLSVVLALLRQ